MQAQFLHKHGISLEEKNDFGRGIYATNNVKAGTVIWNESPISFALKQNVCHHCWNKPNNTQLYRCGNCKFGRYCSKQCQKDDWKQHKIRCKSISKLHGKTPTVTIVSIAELLSNIQPCSSNKSSTLRKLQFELFPTLLHNLDLKTDDEKSDMSQVSLCIAMYMKSLKEIIKNNEIKIDINIINQTLGKFSTNAISICDDEFNSFGIGLFPLLSMINHSCQPNVMVKFNCSKKCAEIRALRNINKNEQLFINYTDITVPKFMRQRVLLKDYCFECKCSFCLNNNENICINLCCKKCGTILESESDVNLYQCNNKQCGIEYDKKKLRDIVDDIESRYNQIKKDVKINCFDNQKRINLLKECEKCLKKIDKIVGKYHWLRISIFKIMEKLQLNLNRFSDCYESNVCILEFYEKWLDEYSPYLGIQYCLTGKLLNYLIHDKINDVYGSYNDNNDEENKERDISNEERSLKRNELIQLCQRSCDWFEKGLEILMISHGNTMFVKELRECQQTAQFNLENVCKL